MVSAVAYEAVRDSPEVDKALTPANLSKTSLCMLYALGERGKLTVAAAARLGSEPLLLAQRERLVLYMLNTLTSLSSCLPEVHNVKEKIRMVQTVVDNDDFSSERDATRLASRNKQRLIITSAAA